MRVAFLGNSEFSLTVLKSIINSNHEVVCVVGSVDSVSGRGQRIVYSPVKTYCIENDIPFLQYKRVSKEGEQDIKSFAPDVLVTASFGQILKQNILDLARFGVINVHCSLLPKYRGSCPVNFAIINGETTSGVTIMRTDLSLDTGDILSQKKIDILSDETAGELLSRLSVLGGEMIVNALDRLEDGTATFTPQNEDMASYFPMLSKDMAYIDFNKTALQIHNFVRGLNPWPVAFAYLNGEIVKVYKATEVENIWGIDLEKFSVGEVVRATPKSGLIVKCGDGLILLEKIQLPNGKIMDSKSFLNGRQILLGTYLGEN